MNRRPTHQCLRPPVLLIWHRRASAAVALLANDEFFAEKENLLKPGRGNLHSGQVYRSRQMDGRMGDPPPAHPGHDWCVVQLGLRGIIKQVDIDTNHFLGNHPPFASLDALCLTNGFPRDSGSRRSASLDDRSLPQSPLKPGSQNLFAVTSDQSLDTCAVEYHPGWRRGAFSGLRRSRSRLEQAEARRTRRSRGGREWRSAARLQRHVLQLDEQPDHARSFRKHGRRVGDKTPARSRIRLDCFEARIGRARSAKSKSTPITSRETTPTCVRSKDAPRPVPRPRTSRRRCVWSEILPKTKLQAHTRHFFEQELAPDR